MMRKELVVARFKEGKEWLAEVPSEWGVIVYNKGYPQDGKPLPNIGREPHTFLTHIVNNYNNLAELTAFVQGRPFDHCNSLFEFLKASEGKELLWLGREQLWSDADGSPAHPGLPVARVAKLLDLDVKFPLPFFPGGQFVVSKKRLLKRPVEFWKTALEIVVLENNTWCFERLWGSILQ